ncbi:MAG: hypothetical protein Q9222_000166 [Ikaeria aurantiellina]
MDADSMTPSLRLRGGGASVKRKEARRRKFSSGDPEARESQRSAFGSPHSSHDVLRTDDAPQSERTAEEAAEPKSHRFLVFIGNLPYTATDDSIQLHFASLKPASVRHRCEKESGKSKGFAFLEFHQYDAMKTCLGTFHQSVFNDGISPPRTLNVELTYAPSPCTSARD